MGRTIPPEIEAADNEHRDEAFRDFATPTVTPTPLEDLEQVCEELFDRWDADMKPGKLLSALTGRVRNYDPRVTRIREALKAVRDGR